MDLGLTLFSTASNNEFSTLAPKRFEMFWRQSMLPDSLIYIPLFCRKEAKWKKIPEGDKKAVTWERKYHIFKKHISRFPVLIAYEAKLISLKKVSQVTEKKPDMFYILRY